MKWLNLSCFTASTFLAGVTAGTLAPHPSASFWWLVGLIVIAIFNLLPILPRLMWEAK